MLLRAAAAAPGDLARNNCEPAAAPAAAAEAEAGLCASCACERDCDRPLALLPPAAPPLAAEVAVVSVLVLVRSVCNRGGGDCARMGDCGCALPGVARRGDCGRGALCGVLRLLAPTGPLDGVLAAAAPVAVPDAPREDLVEELGLRSADTDADGDRARLTLPLALALAAEIAWPPDGDAKTFTGVTGPNTPAARLSPPPAATAAAADTGARARPRRGEPTVPCALGPAFEPAACAPAVAGVWMARAPALVALMTPAPMTEAVRASTTASTAGSAALTPELAETAWRNGDAKGPCCDWPPLTVALVGAAAAADAVAGVVVEARLGAVGGDRERSTGTLEPILAPELELELAAFELAAFELSEVLQLMRRVGDSGLSRDTDAATAFELVLVLRRELLLLLLLLKSWSIGMAAIAFAAALDADSVTGALALTVTVSAAEVGARLEAGAAALAVSAAVGVGSGVDDGDHVVCDDFTRNGAGAATAGTGTGCMADGQSVGPLCGAGREAGASGRVGGLATFWVGTISEDTTTGGIDKQTKTMEFNG